MNRKLVFGLGLCVALFVAVAFLFGFPGMKLFVCGMLVLSVLCAMVSFFFQKDKMKYFERIMAILFVIILLMVSLFFIESFENIFEPDSTEIVQ